MALGAEVRGVYRILRSDANSQCNKEDVKRGIIGSKGQTTGRSEKRERLRESVKGRGPGLS